MGNPSERAQYEAMVRAHAGELYRFAYRLTGKSEIAHDLVQETFLEAWRSIGRLRDEGKSRGWLFSILRHCWSHYVRERVRRIRPTSDQASLEAHAAPHVPPLDRMAEEEMLQRAMDRVSDRYKEAFTMVFVQGLSCKEAAHELKVPLGTVLSRISRARDELRAALSQSYTQVHMGAARNGADEGSKG